MNKVAMVVTAAAVTLALMVAASGVTAQAESSGPTQCIAVDVPLYEYRPNKSDFKALGGGAYTADADVPGVPLPTGYTPVGGGGPSNRVFACR